MLHRRRFAALVITGWAARPLAAQAQPVRAYSVTDRIVLPPHRRVFDSPSGRFQLAITSDDGWQTQRATGALRDLSSQVATLCWRQALPQTRGPRHALVTDQGASVLIDDWINVPSPHALVLIDRGGQQRASYSIDALIALLGVSRRIVTEHGRLGIWLSAAPALSSDGSNLVLASGGRQLILRLADGALSATD